VVPARGPSPTRAHPGVRQQRVDHRPGICVLCSGSPHNYIGWWSTSSAAHGLGARQYRCAARLGDPLCSSAGAWTSWRPSKVERASDGFRRPVTYVTVKEPVTVGGPEWRVRDALAMQRGKASAQRGLRRRLPSAIRPSSAFRITSNRRHVSAMAPKRGRNTTFRRELYCKTIGKLFGRHPGTWGYTTKTFWWPGRRRYVNGAQGFCTEGKSLGGGLAPGHTGPGWPARALIDQRPLRWRCDLLQSRARA